MKYSRFTLKEILNSRDICIHVPTKNASDKLFKFLAEKFPTSRWVTPPNWWKYGKNSTFYIGKSQGFAQIEYSLKEGDFIVSVYDLIGFDDTTVTLKYLV